MPVRNPVRAGKLPENCIPFFRKPKSEGHTCWLGTPWPLQREGLRRLYRNEVSGAVLVDSSHEDQQRFQPASSVRQEAQNLRQFAPFPMLRFFGLLRLRDKLRPAAVRGSKLPLGFGHFPRVTAVQVLQPTFSVYGEGLKQSRRKSPLLGFRKSSWRSTWQAGSPPYWIGDCRS